MVAKCPIGLIQHVSTFEIFCAIAKKRDNHHKIRITRKPEFSRAPRALEKLPYLPLWKFNIKFFAHLRENIYAQAGRRGGYRKFFCVHAGIAFDKKMYSKTPEGFFLRAYGNHISLRLLQRDFGFGRAPKIGGVRVHRHLRTTFGSVCIC